MKRFLLSLALGLLVPHVVQADALRDLDRAASEPAPERSDSSDRERRDDDDDDRASRAGGSESARWDSDDDDEVDQRWLEDDERHELGRALALVLFLPWTLPIRLLDEPCLRGYARFPHEQGRGQLRARDRPCKRPDTRPATPARSSRRMALQLDLESGYMRQEVVPATFALRWQLPDRFELSARGSLLTDRAEPRGERALHDNALVSVRFAQSARVDLRTGLGVRHYRLDRDRWGADALYGVDFYARKYLVGRTELHLGSLQRAFAVELRGTLGIVLGRFELYAGGDVLGLIGPRHRARLGGGVAGVRIWL